MVSNAQHTPERLCVPEQGELVQIGVEDVRDVGEFLIVRPGIHVGCIGWREQHKLLFAVYLCDLGMELKGIIVNKGMQTHARRKRLPGTVCRA